VAGKSAAPRAGPGTASKSLRLRDFLRGLQNSRKHLRLAAHNAAMNRIVSIALLIVGCVLIVYGINASHSFSSDVSRAFTGNPTDHTMWLLIGGVVAAIIGVGGLLRGGTHT
jgi:hypothetical protein